LFFFAFLQDINIYISAALKIKKKKVEKTYFL
jgi:hypothetical protein